MKRHFTPYLIILVLSGIFGLNAVAWIHNHASVLEQPDGTEQVEWSDEMAENAPELDGSDGPEPASAQNADWAFLFSGAASSTDFSYPGLICRSAAIRQSQRNLLNSFQAPAIFILFNTYQGYLS